MERDYDSPVWTTQGDGLVKKAGRCYVFVEAPAPGLGLGVGDTMPSDWGIAPANGLAREFERDQEMFEEGTNDLFELLDDYLDRGKVSVEQAGGFFPEDVRRRNDR